MLFHLTQKWRITVVFIALKLLTKTLGANLKIIENNE